jgi:polysaccharide biosynthesis/export protein
MLVKLKAARIALVLALSIAAAGLAAAAPAGVSKVEWRQGSQQGTGTMILSFDAAAPRFEATARPWGLEIWLEGVALEAAPFEGLRLLKEGAGTRLRFEKAGATLDAVRVAGSVVTFTLGISGQPAPASGSGYLIGVGDVLSLAVYKNQDLSGEFTVGPDGTVTLPLVGAFPAAGRTEATLTQELTGILEKDYLVDPKVTVTVKTYQSQFVYVTGSVSRSSRVALHPAMTLKDVLSEAGVALVPGQEVVLSRTGGTGEKIHLLSAELEAAIAPLPQDGDVLTVQEPLYVFMQGEVRRSGRLALTKGMTLLQAIAMSEGLTDWASKREVRILRKNGEKTEEIRVNLKKVEARETPDPPLLANDVVLVKRRVL